MNNKNKIKCHSKPRPLPLGRAPQCFYAGSNVLDLESSTLAVSQRQQPTWKTLNQVQGDGLFYNSDTGFTLIELLVVVLIIGILAAVALPQYQFAVAKARAANLISMVNAAEQAEEAYYLANSTYTDQWEDLAISFPGTVSEDGKTISQNNTTSIKLIKQDAGHPDSITAANNQIDIQIIYGLTHTTFQLWSGKRTCYAPKTNDLANKICKHVTGDKNKKDNSADHYYYIFQ